MRKDEENKESSRDFTLEKCTIEMEKGVLETQVQEAAKRWRKKWKKQQTVVTFKVTTPSGRLADLELGG